ncbi:hypothetical protein, partial [Brachybacterium sp. AOP3-A1-3]|uniref:hypothetical protein n=1 Tax=Brachybacterium sp. AOP3-A1-3 TaxID=3457699 RepID=UPI004033AAB5
AMEAASQALWITAGGTPRECARRHISLIRWDYEEYRKSGADIQFKKRVKERDENLLARVKSDFTESELKPPGHLQVLREAAPAAALNADHVEAIWRAASGAAHGRAWPALALQHVVPLREYEPGQYTTFRIPDTNAMTDVLNIADAITSRAVLDHAGSCGADVGKLIKDAGLALSRQIPLRDGVSREAMLNLFNIEEQD